MVTSLGQVAALNRDCAEGACAHHGVIKAHSSLTSSGKYSARATSYCLLTMDLDVGTREAFVIPSACNSLAYGMPVSAEIWMGAIVSVTTSAGTTGTFQNPSTGVFVGLYRMLALVPFAVFVAMIHIDIANHRLVRRIWRRSS